MYLKINLLVPKCFSALELQKFIFLFVSYDPKGERYLKNMLNPYLALIIQALLFWGSSGFISLDDGRPQQSHTWNFAIKLIIE